MTDAAVASSNPMHATLSNTDGQQAFGDERPAKRPHSMINEPTGASLDATVSFSAVHEWWQVRARFSYVGFCDVRVCCYHTFAMMRAGATMD